MSFAGGKVPERKSNFKKTLDADEIRRRRSETTVQIRKTIKEDRINQRRRMVRPCVYVCLPSSLFVSRLRIATPPSSRTHRR